MIQVVAVGGEAVAAGIYMTWWFPHVPVWIWSIGFAATLLYVNARSVARFGTFEYWFALIKVAAIVLFIILGGAGILGIGLDPIGFGNLTDLPGGFMPNGFAGVWMAVIMGIFAFNGIELIAVTAGETRDPVNVIPAALRNMVIRLFLFYGLGLLIVVTFVPWTETGAKVVSESPFVRVLAYTGFAHAAGWMNFVVLSAALSSMNVNIYLSSRMLFSLARGGYAPEVLGRLNANRTPLAAIVVSGAGIVSAAAVARFTPHAYNYLFGIALFGAIFVWLIILSSHIGFRRAHAGRELPVRMPLFPWLQWCGIALLAAVLITMGLDTEFWNVSWIVGVPWLVLLSGAYFVRRRYGAHQAPRK
jgi:L-asparagine transporter-like permease